MDIKTYNGWSNYATWRINLEMIDGGAIYDEEQTFDNVYELSQYLKDYCEEQMYNYDINEPCIVIDYALAFLSDVNWYEIAQHIADDNQKMIIDYTSRDSFTPNTNYTLGELLDSKNETIKRNAMSILKTLQK